MKGRCYLVPNPKESSHLNCLAFHCGFIYLNKLQQVSQCIYLLHNGRKHSKQSGKASYMSGKPEGSERLKKLNKASVVGFCLSKRQNLGTEVHD